MNSAMNQFTREEIAAHHALFVERTVLYKKHGLDQEEARNAIIRQISKNCRSILEIGTGKGHFTALLAASFERIDTVDLDAQAHRAAMLHVSFYGLQDRIRFVTADSEDLGYADRSFDAVVSAYTFHHLVNPFKVIREMIRVAATQVVISDFSDAGFALIDRVHATRGPAHEREAGDFSIVGVFLKEHGFNVTVVEDRWQILYSAVRKNQ